MPTISTVSPFRCRVWELHDRLEYHLSEESCKAELDSFSKHGQLVPTIGRPVHDDRDFEVEIVCGARRLFVARHLNKPLLVEIREMSDREAIVAMDIENRQRSDISPYERGLSYARWIRAGFFDSQDSIARALKVSSSQVSRLLKLAKLPSVIVDAFESPLDICEGWGLDVMEALDNPERRAATIQRARSMGQMNPRLTAREVYRELLAASVRGRKPKVKSHDEVVKSSEGIPLFRIRYQRNSIALVLPLEKVSAAALESIRKSLLAILRSSAGAGSRTSEHEPVVPTLVSNGATRHRNVEALGNENGARVE